LPEKPGLAANDAVIGRAVAGGTAEDVDADLLLVNITGAPFDEPGTDELEEAGETGGLGEGARGGDLTK